MAHDVFISNAFDDKPIADAMCAKLEQNQIRCWIAPRDITPGEKVAGAVIGAIDQSELIIVVFSRKADHSPMVRNEIERAFTREKIIIPFRIEDIQPSDEVQYFIGSRHWLDALTPPLEEHLNRLVDSVNRILKEKNGALSGPGEIDHLQVLPPPGKEMYSPVGFPWRLGAYFVDNLVIFFGVVAPGIILGDRYQLSTSNPDSFFSTLFFVIWPLAYIIYFMAWELSVIKATPGKVIFSVSVVNEMGGRISLESSLIRTLIKCFTLSIAGLTIIIDPSTFDDNRSRRAIYDTWARTRVVRKDSGSNTSWQALRSAHE
jgi:uncharacterized RDD family membrane protein YckC